MMKLFRDSHEKVRINLISSGKAQEMLSKLLAHFGTSYEIIKLSKGFLKFLRGYFDILEIIRKLLGNAFEILREFLWNSYKTRNVVMKVF